jgi:hypothetical protein
MPGFCLTQVIGGTDVFKGEVATVLDGQRLADREYLAEGCDGEPGLPDIGINALTHWTCDESRWFVGGPSMVACHRCDLLQSV